MVAYLDDFLLMMALIVAPLPLILLLRNPGGGPAARGARRMKSPRGAHSHRQGALDMYVTVAHISTEVFHAICCRQQIRTP